MVAYFMANMERLRERRAVGREGAVTVASDEACPTGFESASSLIVSGIDRADTSVNCLPMSWMPVVSNTTEHRALAGEVMAPALFPC